MKNGRFREMRLKTRAVSQDQAIEIADRALWATLALCGEDGPYCVALSVVREGDRFYFHCAKEGHKIDCLRTDARVCLSLVDGAQAAKNRFTMYYRSCIVFGRAVRVSDPQEIEHALRLLCMKYDSCEEGFDAECAAWGAKTDVWRIDAEKITGKQNLPK